MTPEQLLHHIDTGHPWPARGGDEFTDLPLAYQTALAVRALRLARGEIPRGYKVGFTNRGLWSRYGVFAPMWSSVWETTLSFAPGAGGGEARLSLARLCQPRIEPETVFGFKAVPRVDASFDDLFDALDWVAPGFEIVQSHLAGWKFTAAQTVADSGLHGRLLVGQSVPLRSLARDAAELHRLLAQARVGLYKNGVRAEQGVGSNVLDSPLRALMHFLIELRACPGATDIAAGDVVTTGTWTDAWPVQAGELWRADFDSALPALQVSFD